ncbi:MAG: AzlD domain-containing protein [Rhodospirillaceae bacterium]|nr:AzlD domain-containing protein [Rhodospirillaceae bacterium]
MSDNVYLLIVIAVMAVATFATRAFPFVALKGKGDHPLMDYIGRYIPPAVMAILVFYSMKNIDVFTAPFGASEFIALSITAVVHLWKRNSLLSIFSATAFYMIAVQYGLFL